MPENVIQTTNLNFTYPDKTRALKKINLNIQKGEKVAFIGSNGAGKSTLFLNFNGILRPTSGEIVVDGITLDDDKQVLMEIRQKLGLVFQNPDHQLFAPTVLEDVAFGPTNLGLNSAEIEKRVDSSLQKVGMLEFKHKPPHHLSGGQKKRVAIAGILAMQPDIMVLDEPTSGLDPYGVFQILKILHDLHKEGMTILLTSHDVDIIPLFADRIYVMHHGEVAGEGTPEKIFSSPELVKKAHLRQPQVADLLYSLKNTGIDIKIKLTVAEARDELLRILGKHI
ncbi:MAG: energy-coupling factor ABC transporter ATP-binding protein [Methanobacterium sp.]|nr:MAG: energy-coupling factor ABC transporter ATP-binding protein [Methanobacterium sp.]